MRIDPVPSDLALANLERLRRILINRTDPDYRPEEDKRLTKDFLGAEVVKGVLIGAEGAILSCRTVDNFVLVKVDLSYIPGDQDPLEVIPCSREDLGREHNTEERQIMALDDRVLKKYGALFQASNLFNHSQKVRLAS